jgi:hypothetical protein
MSCNGWLLRQWNRFPFEQWVSRVHKKVLLTSSKVGDAMTLG